MPVELRVDVLRLVVARFGVLLISLSLAWIVATQFGREALEGLGVATPQVTWGVVALRAALICFACFAGASTAHLIGQRTGHPVGAAMIAVTCRTGGVAVCVLVIWLVFYREQARVELAVLAFMYCISLIADTLAWLIEIRWTYDTPKQDRATEVHSSADKG